RKQQSPPKEGSGAVKKTRTSTGCPTATSTLRVYQFRHHRIASTAGRQRLANHLGAYKAHGRHPHHHLAAPPAACSLAACPTPCTDPSMATARQRASCPPMPMRRRSSG